MSRFSDKHPIEAVRGLQRPTMNCMRRELAQRAAWLAKKLVRYRNLHDGEPQYIETSPILRELVVIARLMEILKVMEL